MWNREIAVSTPELDASLLDLVAAAAHFGSFFPFSGIWKIFLDLRVSEVLMIGQTLWETVYNSFQRVSTEVASKVDPISVYSGIPTRSDQVSISRSSENSISIRYRFQTYQVRYVPDRDRAMLTRRSFIEGDPPSPRSLLLAPLLKDHDVSRTVFLFVGVASCIVRVVGTVNDERRRCTESDRGALLGRTARFLVRSLDKRSEDARSEVQSGLSSRVDVY